MRGINKTKIFLVLAIICLAAGASALDNLMGLQGTAENSGPINNGNITVLIWNQAAGGSLVYNSSTDFIGKINQGRYDLLLGEDRDLTLDYGTYYYLDLVINGQNLDFNGSARKIFQSGIGQISSQYIKANAINSSHISDGSITDSDIALASIDKSRIRANSSWQESDIPSLTSTWSNTLNATRIVSQNLLNVNSSQYAQTAQSLGGYGATQLLSNDSALAGNISALNSGKLDVTDQRYNETSAINAVNSSVSSKAGTGVCSGSFVVQNTTAAGVQCITLDTAVVNNVTQNVTYNITNNVTNNVTTNVSNNVVNNVSYNITTNITQNITNDITNNITNNITTNITNNVVNNITNNYTSNDGSGGWINSSINTTTSLQLFVTNNITANNFFGSLNWSWLLNIPSYVKDWASDIAAVNTNIVNNITGVNSNIANNNTQLSDRITAVNGTANSKALPGNCAAGKVVQNTTTGGVECVTPSLTESDPLFVAQNNSLWDNISSKLDAVDQRYNESAAISAKLDSADQRYNESSAVAAVNSTTNIQSLGFNTTSQLNTFYYPVSNPNGFIAPTNDAVFIPIYNEFMKATTAYFDPWIGAQIGAGTIAGSTGVNHPGTIVVSSSVTASSGYSWITEVNAFLINGTEYTEIIANITPKTSNWTNYRLGFQDSATATAPVDGVFFNITNLTVVGVTRKNNFQTFTASSFNITGREWYKFRINIDNTLYVNFSIYNEAGSMLWSDNISQTNVPNNLSAITGHGIVTWVSGGTTAQPLMNVDYMLVGMTRPLVR